MAEEEKEEQEQQSTGEAETDTTSFIDKLASGDDEGFKSDIRKHVVDAVAQQVSGTDDVSFDTGDSKPEEDNSGDEAEKESEGDQ